MADDAIAGAAKRKLIAASTRPPIDRQMDDTGMLHDPVQFNPPTANPNPQEQHEQSMSFG